MTHSPFRPRAFQMPLLLVVLLAPLPPALRAQSTEIAFRRVVPMGLEALRLDPAGRSLYLLASAEVPSFDGMKRIGKVGRAVLFNNSGKTVDRFPRTLIFRVTASLREDRLHEAVRSPVEVRDNPDQLLLALRFRLKAYRALEYRLFQPTEVKLIGVPADVPYDQRIYRVQFEVGDLPISDRTVLEVIAPNGERLARFHLELI